MASDDNKPDVEPVDSRADGSQKAEGAVGELIPREGLKDLMKRQDVADTVSGLAELDPTYLGGTASAVLLVNWLNQLCGQVRDLDTHNRELQEKLTDALVRNAELTGEVNRLKSNQWLREGTMVGGSLLLGGAVGFYATSPGLSILTGLVGVLFLGVGLFAGRSS